MINCDSCNSKRVLDIGGKASDCHQWEYMGREGDGYAPRVPNICGGDDIHLSVCLDCGKVQGKFPVVSGDLAESVEDSDATRYFLDNYGNTIGTAYYIGKLNPNHIADKNGLNLVSTKLRLGSEWNKKVECFFIDFYPNFGSSCTYVFIDTERNMKMCEYKHSWPPHDSIERIKIVV